MENKIAGFELVSNTLPTEPQPLPIFHISFFWTSHCLFERTEIKRQKRLTIEYKPNESLLKLCQIFAKPGHAVITAKTL